MARFEAGAITPPKELDQPGRAFTVPLESSTVRDPALLEALLEAEVESLRTICPNWRHISPADTLDDIGNRIELVDFKDDYVLLLRRGANVDRSVQALTDRPGVSSASCNRLGILHYTPNDPDYPSQWHLNNTGQQIPGELPCTPGWDMNAPEGWDHWTHAGSMIGIFDSGISVLNTDLTPYIAPSPVSASFISGLNWWEYATHGSKVAGVAGARGNNASVVAGVANLDTADPNPFLVAIKIAGTAQSPPATVSELDVAAGLDHICSPIVYPSVKVTNHSYGIIAYRNCTSIPSPAYRDAARNAYQKNILVVSAAGNGDSCAGNIPSCSGQVPDTCIYYPAAFPEYSLTVTTVDCWGEISDPLKSQGSHIDVSAPAGWDGDITTTAPQGGSTTTFGMTSAASPMVAGLAALLLGRDVRLINDDLSEIIRRTTRPVGSYPPIDVGRGLIQADDVLALLDSPRQLGFATVTGNYTSQYLETRDVQLRNVSGVGLTGEDWGNFRVEVWQVDYVGTLKSPFGTPSLYDTVFDLAWPRHRLCTGWRRIDDQINSSYDAKLFGNHVDLLYFDATGEAHFRTYTYKIFDQTGQQFLCWQPFKPSGQSGSCAASGSFKISYGVVAHLDDPGMDERGSVPKGKLALRTRARIVSGDLIVQCRATAGAIVTIDVIDTSGRCTYVVGGQFAVAEGESTFRTRWPSELSGSVYFLRFIDAETGRTIASDKIVVSR